MTLKNRHHENENGKAARGEAAFSVPKIGRPTLYSAELCDRVIEMGSKGYSLAQMAREIGVVRDTLYRWMKEYQEFSDAMSRARELSLAWWEDQGMDGLWAGKDFNDRAYQFQIKNRFPDDYRDKCETKVSGGLTLEEIVAGRTREESDE